MSTNCVCVCVCVCVRARANGYILATMFGVWVTAEKFIGDGHECSAVTLTNNNNKNL
jgi:hypothetical protein